MRRPGLYRGNLRFRAPPGPSPGRSGAHPGGVAVQTRLAPLRHRALRHILRQGVRPHLLRPVRGLLRQRLEDAREAFGGRVVLAVERVAEDFFLPSPTGQGIPLTREELRTRMAERAPSVFFSSELCAHYFTYMSRENGAHFILFDDAGSIRKKLRLARSLGMDTAVLAYPQVDDLLPQILEE